MLKGIPFSATEQKIAEFFDEYNVSNITTKYVFLLDWYA